MTLEDAYPLTALQAGMLFHSSYREDSPTYHDVFTMTVNGAYDETVLRAALSDVIARHPVLRTSFDLTDFEEPLQLVWETANPVIERVTDLDAWREAESGRPFRWEEPPLFRIAVRAPDAGGFGLGIAFHHAILDGWSISMLTAELLRSYGVRLAGEAPPQGPASRGFREFVARERAAVADQETAAFWREVLDEAPGGMLPRLPGYRTGDAEAAVRHAVPLAAETVAGLERAARTLRVPLRTVLLAAHLHVLAILTGEDEAITGMVTHGRPEDEAAGEILGLFLNSVPVRARTDVRSWANLIDDVFAREIALLPHRLYPLFEMQRGSGRSPVFDALFDYRDFEAYREIGDRGGITISDTEFFEQTNLAFAANFTRSPATGALTLELKYDRTQFPADQIAEAGAYYRRAFEEIADDPGRAPGRVPLDTETVEKWNATGPAIGSGTLAEAVARQAASQPDASAVCDSAGRWLSYAEFTGRVNALAVRLREAGTATGDVVGVCLPRGVDMLVAVHAVVAAGAAYLPLEPSYPDERLRFMAEDSAAKIVITDDPGRFPTTLSPDAGTAVAGPDVPLSPRAPAYVIYTSGSTGTPKGVVVSHAAITNRLAWMGRAFPLGPDDRVLHKTPFSFDVSVWELFWPLMAGAGTVVAGPEDHRDTLTLSRLINDHGVTTLHFVPSMLQAFLEEPELDLPGLRRVICSGEALPSSLVARFHERLPGVELHNLYGPTEAAVDVTWHACETGERHTPIGAPIAGIRIEILDRAGRRVPVGTPGELCIAGVGLADGYLGRPGLTAQRFSPDEHGPPGGRIYHTGDLARRLPSGEIDYLGRMDHQVKVRGMRVEPGETEAAIADHPGVATAVVLARDGVLAAYVIPTPDAGDELGEELPGYLRGRLPDHQVPSSYILLDRLPVTANGKLNRAALPTPNAVRRPYEAPRNDAEQLMARTWEEVLGVERIGIRDDFFELGGHSLLALRLAMRLRQELGREVPVGTVLTAPTVAELVTALQRPAGDRGPDRIVALRATGDRPPIFLIHALGGEVFRYHPLARAFGDDQPVYAIPAHGLTPDDPPHATIEEMADAYAGYIRSVRPYGPYFVGGFCIGGNIAIEVARLLREAGESVPAVFLAWSSADEPVVRSTLEDDTALMIHALAGGLETIDLAALSELDPADRLLAIIDAASEEGSLRQRPDDLEQVNRYLGVFRANAHAAGYYKHRIYDGNAVLLIPELDGAPEDEDYGWRSVVPGLQVGRIPGARFSSFFDPYVGRTAAIWRRWMDRGVGHDPH